jgi:hypothetical protein
MTKKITYTLILLFILILPALTMAATCPPGMSLADCQAAVLGQVGNNSGYGAVNTNPDISSKIGQLISYVLAMLGVVFLVLVVISGIQWMTAGGNEEKVTKARTRLVNASIGLGIIIAAYAITFFVVSKLQTAVTLPQPTQTPTLAKCSNFSGNNTVCTSAGNENACTFNNSTNECFPSDSQSCLNRLPGDCTETPLGWCTTGSCTLKADNSGCECI